MWRPSFAFPLLAAVCLCFATCESSYMLMLPSHLQGGTTEKFCLSLFDIKQDVYVIFLVHDEENQWNFNKRDTYIKGESRCTSVVVPEVNREGNYKLTVWGFGQNHSLLFSGTLNNLKILNNNTLTFIQTDKYLYLPKQTVKFRILTTTVDLKPRIGMIAEVVVMNPDDIKVKKWTNIATTTGLVSLEMPISLEPALGKWTIQTKVNEKITEITFEIQKYELPRFEVVIEPPSYLLVTSPKISGRICARYPQHKIVHGVITAEICIKLKHEESSRPCATFNSQINGCVNFSVNSSEVGLILSQYPIKDASLQIMASVKEDKTGMMVNATKIGPKISSEALIIDLQSESPDYFKPGLTYNGRALIMRPDWSRTAHETIEITAIDYINDIRLGKNYTSDGNGVIDFHINQFRKNTEIFHIVARSINCTYQSGDDEHIMFTPRSSLKVHQWFSPSSTFLQVLPISGPSKCGDRLAVNLSYTAKPNTNVDLFYVIVSKGKLVHKSKASFKFGSQTEEIGPDKFLLEIISTSKPSSIAKLLTGPVRTLKEEVKPKITKDDNKLKKKKKKKKKRKRGKHKKGPKQDHRKKTRTSITQHYPVNLKLTFTLTAEMSPLSYLVAYIRGKDSEIVSDFKEFQVDACFQNQVKLKIQDKNVQAGHLVTMELSAHWGSTCVLNLVDQSIPFLSGKSWITTEKIFKNLQQYHPVLKDSTSLVDEYCEKKLKIKSQDEDERSKRFISLYSSNYVDSMHAFKASGLLVFTDLVTETRPCKWLDNPPGAADALWDSFYSFPEAASDDTEVEKETLLAKEELNALNYSPETWIWEEVNIGDLEKVNISTMVPYSLTQWTGNVFCTSDEAGIGIFPVTAISTSQPFFVLFPLCASAVLGERVPVSITVTTLNEGCLSVKLKILPSSDYEVFPRGRELCPCKEEAAMATYYITPTVFGIVNVTVEAEMVRPKMSCPNSSEITISGVKEVITKQLSVKSQGFPHESIQNFYICPEDDEDGIYSDIIELHFPDDAIQESVVGRLSVIGDVIGVGVSGLDRLISTPTATGEGNMVALAVCIYILDYLNTYDGLADDIDRAAMANMEKVYQQQLNYMLPDGSFSIFAHQEAMKSIRLTAFVIQIFVKAYAYIYLDNKPVQKAILWLRDQQLPNGCYAEVASLQNIMKKNNDSDSQLVTAHVMISLLESGTPPYDETIENGFKCLKSLTPNDTYTLSLYAYAYSLYRMDDETRQEHIQDLESRSFVDDNIKYWRNTFNDELQMENGQFNSIDLETTAYALLAYLSSGTDDILYDVLPIIHWLTKQRNSYGGFVTSQDTVVAFQALTKYASITNEGETDLELSVSGPNLRQTFYFGEANRLDLQSIPLNNLPITLEVYVRGNGCAFLQTTLSYNQHSLEASTPGFGLTLTVQRETKPKTCGMRVLKICCKYLKPKELSNFAIMQIKMATGWIPIESSLDQFLNETSLKVKKYEITEDHTINLYILELNDTGGCIHIGIEQVLRLSESMPAIVKLYDYFNTGLSAYSQYRIKTTCGTKEELPYNSSKLLDVASFIQARLPHPTLPTTSQELTASTTPTADEKEISAFSHPSRCPVCYRDVPAIFKDMFCNAEAAYKTMVSRQGDYGLKVMSNLRQRKKQMISLFVNSSLPENCQCPLFKNYNEKVLILTRFSSLHKRNKLLYLDPGTSVFPLTFKLEKEVRRLPKSCGF